MLLHWLAIAIIPKAIDKTEIPTLGSRVAARTTSWGVVRVRTASSALNLWRTSKTKIALGTKSLRKFPNVALTDETGSPIRHAVGYFTELCNLFEYPLKQMLGLTTDYLAIAKSKTPLEITT